MKKRKRPMPDVSATRFKNNFFQYLDKIEQGESFNIIRNKAKIATIHPNGEIKWQDQMTTCLKSSFELMDLITPVEDVWEDYR